MDTYGEVCIICILVWGYERGGSYVLCSHSRLLWAGMFIVGVHACWTTSGEVRRVRPRASRFVEAYGIPMTMVEYVLISYRLGWWFQVFFMFGDNDLGSGYAWHYHERVGSWLVMEHVINMSGKVHIKDTLLWEYEWEGSYVPCSHLRVVASGKVRN